MGCIGLGSNGGGNGGGLGGDGGRFGGRGGSGSGKSSTSTGNATGKVTANKYTAQTRMSIVRQRRRILRSSHAPSTRSTISSLNMKYALCHTEGFATASLCSKAINVFCKSVVFDSISASHDSIPSSNRSMLGVRPRRGRGGAEAKGGSRSSRTLFPKDVLLVHNRRLLPSPPWSSQLAPCIDF